MSSAAASPELRHELEVAFEPFEEITAHLREQRDTRPAEEIEGYLDSGMVSDVFYVDEHEAVIKLPRLDAGSAAQSVTRYVDSLHIGIGRPGYEQLLAASGSAGAVVTKCTLGASVLHATFEDVLSMKNGRLNALCDSLDFLQRYGREEENVKDIFYDISAPTPEEAFTLVDFREILYNRSNNAVTTLMEFGVAMQHMPQSAYDVCTKADLEVLKAHQAARLDLARRVAAIAVERYT